MEYTFFLLISASFVVDSLFSMLQKTEFDLRFAFSFTLQFLEKTKEKMGRG